MKHAILLLAIALISACSQSPEKAFISSAKALEPTLSGPAFAYDTQDFDDSPTKMIFLVDKVSMTDIKADVMKTDSVINPLVGVITATMSVEQNLKCGSFSPSHMPGEAYPVTLEEAKDGIDKASCWRPAFSSDCVIKLSYALQDGSWRLNAVNATIPACKMIISGATGLEANPRFKAHNDAWKKLATLGG